MGAMTMQQCHKTLAFTFLALACMAPLAVVLAMQHWNMPGPTMSFILSSEGFAPLFVIALALLIHFGHKAHAA